jgi:tetratricopeptide (TPR) repeat protein
VRPFAAAASAGSTEAAGGLCDALTLPLVRIPALRVVPCSATRQPVAAALDDARLARLLAVSHVIKGTVEALPGERLRLRVAMQPAAGPDATQPGAGWQIDEEIALADLQALPQRIAAATGRALGHAAAPAAAPVAQQVARHTLAPALYSKYLRAVQLGQRESIADWRESLALLDEVLALAPEHFPSRYVHWTVRGRLGGNRDPHAPPLGNEQMAAVREALRAEGLALAQQALAADPDDLRGHWLLVSTAVTERRWPDALDRLDAILQRHPLLPGYPAIAARIHLHLGYLERARTLALAALHVNALDQAALEVLALVAGMRGEHAQHRELLELARQVGHTGLGYSHVIEAARRADWPEVERRLTAWVAWGGKFAADWVPVYVRGLAEPVAREAAVAVLDDMDAATRRHFASYFIEYALLGAHERALESVQRHAALPPAVWMQWLWWPELTTVRREPGFVQAMHELGVTAVWERRGAPELCERAGVDWVCR